MFHVSMSDVSRFCVFGDFLRSQLPRPVDLVFVDHSKALYVAEIHRLEAPVSWPGWISSISTTNSLMALTVKWLDDV